MGVVRIVIDGYGSLSIPESEANTIKAKASTEYAKGTVSCTVTYPHRNDVGHRRFIPYGHAEALKSACQSNCISFQEYTEV